MEYYHRTDEDLPLQSDRERERLRIEQAMAEFLSRGGAIHTVAPSKRSTESNFIINAEKTAQLKANAASQAKKKADVFTDTELARLLRAHCTAGASLQSAAGILNQTIKRCELIARRYQIPFRSAAFSKSRAHQ
ncbi:hypothetical protein [Pseudomonas viridiflava]|uniref:hypothetical protein n=1 Tax=Pseudomonas viridiflava TaxID=33069 RepID=UPI002EC85960|nr:hypothetical protein [Pseudomonas viridiflava]